MFKPTAIAIPLLTLFLAACGGGGGDDVVGSSGNGAGSDGGSDNGDGSSPATVDPDLGSGIGAQFVSGAISAGSFSVVAGSSLEITVNGVDSNQANAALSSIYQYTITSQCSSSNQASFSIANATSSTGTLTTTYQNINCANGDTITARLFQGGADTSVVDNALATATLVINTALPKLGNGSGADFVDGQIGGLNTISGSESVELTATAVNPLDNNAALDSSDYEVEWSSDCSAGSFTLEKQSLEDEIRTRYSSDITNADCLNNDNVIGLRLYERSNPSVTLASSNKNIAVELGVAPKIGNGSGSPGFNQGSLLVSPSTLSAGGTAVVEVSVVDGNNSDALVSNKAYGLVISSTCFQELPPLVTFPEEEKIISQGEARFAYTADGCEGSDQITVTLYDVSGGEIDRSRALATASGSVTVNSAEVGAINFNEISEQLLSMRGVGNPALPGQSVVSFIVTDRNGNPISNQSVDFELSATVGGLNLTSSSDITDSEGKAEAIVNTGTEHAIVSVKATTTTSTGVELETNSLPISITTGYPDQDSFDVSVNILNPGAGDINGADVTVTVFAADQFNNRVPDGTVINFTAESGSIGSSCSIQAGECTVNWSSSGDRPGRHAAALQRVNEVNAFDSSTVFGMTTILAYTQGEGSFNDSNGNGLFEVGEPFDTFAEAFRDDNTNGSIDNGTSGAPVEFFADFNNNNAYNNAPVTYQGVACAASAKAAGHCASQMNVRASTRLVQSNAISAPSIRYFVRNNEVGYSHIELTNGVTYLDTVTVLLQDSNGNIPASGTTAAFSADGYKVNGDSGVVPNSIGYLNETNDPNGFPVNRGALYTMTITLDDPTDLGPLETAVTLGAVSVRGSLEIRLSPPTIRLLYRSGNADDGDGVPELGEEFSEYEGSALTADGSAPELWAVVEDATNTAPVLLASPSDFTATETSDAVVAVGTRTTAAAADGDFPVGDIRSGAFVYPITVTKNADTSFVLTSTANYEGGQTRIDTAVFVP